MVIKILNGPNINMVGTRQTEIYGNVNMVDFIYHLKGKYADNEFSIFQSNHEGTIIDEIQKSVEEKVDGIIFNAGAFSHYSYAIRDAILSIKIPVVEVHISNIYAREEFRQKSVISDVCKGVISGFGLFSYEMAILYLTQNISKIEQ